MQKWMNALLVLLSKDQLRLHSWDCLVLEEVHLAVLHLHQEGLNYLMRNVAVPMDPHVFLSAESDLHVWMAHL